MILVLLLAVAGVDDAVEVAAAAAAAAAAALYVGYVWIRYGAPAASKAFDDIKKRANETFSKADATPADRPTPCDEATADTLPEEESTTEASTTSERPPLPANPDDLLDEGYEEISHPDAKANGHRTFRNPKTGDVVRFDKGKPGEPGWEGKDHYHRSNPNRTGKRDQYLDADGKPVGRASDESHLVPGK